MTGPYSYSIQAKKFPAPSSTVYHMCHPNTATGKAVTTGQWQVLKSVPKTVTGDVIAPRLSRGLRAA